MRSAHVLPVMPYILGAAGAGRRTIGHRLNAANRAFVPDGKQLLVVVDWREGLTLGTRRSLALVAPVIEPQVIIAVNKLDLAGFEYEAFKAARRALYVALAHLPLHAVQIIPVSAKYGDMIESRGSSIDWYLGPTLVDAIAPSRLDLTALAA